MESRIFIKHANEMIAKIERQSAAIGTADDIRQAREQLQKEVSQLFAGLQNPTLPTAYRLRDAANRAGIVVDPRVLHRLAQFDNITTG